MKVKRTVWRQLYGFAKFQAISAVLSTFSTPFDVSSCLQNLITGRTLGNVASNPANDGSDLEIIPKLQSSFETFLGEAVVPKFTLAHLL